MIRIFNNFQKYTVKLLNLPWNQATKNEIIEIQNEFLDFSAFEDFILLLVVYIPEDSQQIGIQYLCLYVHVLTITLSLTLYIVRQH